MVSPLNIYNYRTSVYEVFQRASNLTSYKIAGIVSTISGVIPDNSKPFEKMGCSFPLFTVEHLLYHPLIISSS